MKVLILGDKATVTKLFSALDTPHVKIVDVSDRVDNLKTLKQCENAKIALLDDPVEDLGGCVTTLKNR